MADVLHLAIPLKATMLVEEGHDGLKLAGKESACVSARALSECERSSRFTDLMGSQLIVYRSL